VSSTRSKLRRTAKPLRVLSAAVTGVMLTKFCQIRFVAFYLATTVAFASSPIPTEILINWEERSYSTTAPDPFGRVKISIAAASNGTMVHFSIETAKGVVPIEGSLFEDISLPSEPEIAYSDPDQSKTGIVEYIDIVFEVGEPYLIDFGDDIPGCASPCTQLDRDLVRFRVKANMSVERTYIRLSDVFANREHNQ